MERYLVCGHCMGELIIIRDDACFCNFCEIGFVYGNAYQTLMSTGKWRLVEDEEEKKKK